MKEKEQIIEVLLPASQYEIGQKFIPLGKTKRVHTVVDIIYTLSKREGTVGRPQYLCEHDFMGQIIKSLEVEATITGGLHQNGKVEHQ
jgi:hypothetical protein